MRVKFNLSKRNEYPIVTRLGQKVKIIDILGVSIFNFPLVVKVGNVAGLKHYRVNGRFYGGNHKSDRDLFLDVPLRNMLRYLFSIFLKQS